jgi:hypothetical protein
MSYKTFATKNGFAVNISSVLKQDLHMIKVNSIIFFTKSSIKLFQFQLTVLWPSPTDASKFITISDITGDVCKILQSKSNNWIIKIIYEALIKSKIPISTCPFKTGNYSMTNSEFTDEFIPTTIKHLGNWRKKRIFRANLNLFTKLPNIPKNKPFLSYTLEGELKM